MRISDDAVYEMSHEALRGKGSEKGTEPEMRTVKRKRGRARAEHGARKEAVGESETSGAIHDISPLSSPVKVQRRRAEKK